ncbi:MAG: S-adenosylmethionine--diacylglycerol 3-amino-3-carboxypropyl transferase [Verrucomicrobia bacterium 12-59-8]|nr:MAG: S-adenosylmethionine--diacylglycerol 3-amino-3-carboxypropyl transferase [Verrucomicrobia bacterium 12-59-8]
MLKSAHDMVFRHVHNSNLIYNTAWEDPRLDRQLMQLGADSRVVMITSAGCNALDYLLDNPAEIHAVDMNYRQNALLELKQALIRKGEFTNLFEMFGFGSHAEYAAVYGAVREMLSEPAQKYWDKRISFFNPTTLKKSFYYNGTSGIAAYLMGNVLFKLRPNVKNFATCLLDARSLQEQREAYELFEREVWGPFSNWLLRQPTLMTLLGVPRPQIKLIQDSYPGGLTSYVKDKLRHVFTELPIADNYFWRVYMTGSYTLGCCPNYLKQENLPALQSRVDRLKSYTTTLSGFLREYPGKYTHFVLLDHQDWLAAHDTEALLDEWELILANSAPGAKILMRSAGVNLDFVPEVIRSRVRFCPERTEALHQQDRVGTYGSLHFAEVL